MRVSVFSLKTCFDTFAVGNFRLRCSPFASIQVTPAGNVARLARACGKADVWPDTTRRRKDSFEVSVQWARAY
jgi:hypothetical protein